MMQKAAVNFGLAFESRGHSLLLFLFPFGMTNFFQSLQGKSVINLNYLFLTSKNSKTKSVLKLKSLVTSDIGLNAIRTPQ